ncbi:MAG: glycosyltransferase family 4 protein, partial [Acidimicrobiales bacterium]
MRIQWLLPGVEVSGGVICVLRHAAGLQQRGHEVTVFVSQPVDPARVQMMPSAVRHLELVPQPPALPEADVQIATHYSTVLAVAQAPGRLRAHFIQHVETLFAHDLPNAGILVPFIKMSLSLPVYRIANSSWAQSTLGRLFGYHTDLAINAGPGPQCRPAKPEVERPAVVVSFVHPSRWKGTADAYNALVLARSLEPGWDIQWHVFGSGTVPDEPWVHHHGVLPHDDLPALYQKAAVVLFTSWAESYPLPPLEAMASGAVVVTTPFGVEDYVQAGTNALVVPPRDPRAAGNAVLDALGASPG